MIEIQDLAKTFKHTPVLAGVNLEIPTGNRVALVGANGAGKTTLIRCLLGEYTHEGAIRIDGRIPRKERKTVLRGVGFVPQIPPPLRMPVDQLLRFAAHLCGSDPLEMERVAAQLGLEVGPIRHQPFAKLSGGQKQKLLIAVALGREARLLIMDEPAANLDPEARRSFLALLAKRAAGTTMLISSHRLDEVSDLVDRVIELDHGRVALDDRVSAPAGLVSQIHCRLELRDLEPRVVRNLGDWGFVRDGDSEFVWRLVLPAAERLRLLGMISRYGGSFRSVRLEYEPNEADGVAEL